MESFGFGEHVNSLPRAALMFRVCRVKGFGFWVCRGQGLGFRLCRV